MDNKIKNTIAFITGGASGIGKAVAARIVDKGGRVVIVDSNPAGREVAEEFGDRAKFVRADVCSEEDVKQALDLSKKTFGGLNVVVNSAGIAARGDPYDFETGEPHSLELYRRLMDVNVLGTFNVTRLSAATKAAVAGMTLPLARAFAPEGIRVVAVAPGYVETPMTLALREASKHQTVNVDVVNLSPKRRASPDEIAHVIQCIIENAFINAEVIRVDGGYRYVPPLIN